MMKRKLSVLLLAAVIAAALCVSGAASAEEKGTGAPEVVIDSATGNSVTIFDGSGQTTNVFQGYGNSSVSESGLSETVPDGVTGKSFDFVVKGRVYQGFAFPEADITSLSEDGTSTGEGNAYYTNNRDDIALVFWLYVSNHDALAAFAGAETCIYLTDSVEANRFSDIRISMRPDCTKLGEGWNQIVWPLSWTDARPGRPLKTPSGYATPDLSKLGFMGFYLHSDFEQPQASDLLVADVRAVRMSAVKIDGKTPAVGDAATIVSATPAEGTSKTLLAVGDMDHNDYNVVGSELPQKFEGDALVSAAEGQSISLTFDENNKNRRWTGKFDNQLGNFNLRESRIEFWLYIDDIAKLKAAGEEMYFDLESVGESVDCFKWVVYHPNLPAEEQLLPSLDTGWNKIVLRFDCSKRAQLGVVGAGMRKFNDWDYFGIYVNRTANLKMTDVRLVQGGAEDGVDVYSAGTAADGAVSYAAATMEAGSNLPTIDTVEFATKTQAVEYTATKTVNLPALKVTIGGTTKSVTDWSKFVLSTSVPSASVTNGVVTLTSFGDVTVTAKATDGGGEAALFKITMKKYAITYDLGGGVNASSNPAAYDENTETVTLASPTREGYDFKGWYASADFSGQAVTQIAKGSSGDVALFAKWEKKPDTSGNGTDKEPEGTGCGKKSASAALSVLLLAAVACGTKFLK